MASDIYHGSICMYLYFKNLFIVVLQSLPIPCLCVEALELLLLHRLVHFGVRQRRVWFLIQLVFVLDFRLFWLSLIRLAVFLLLLLLLVCIIAQDNLVLVLAEQPRHGAGEHERLLKVHRVERQVHRGYSFVVLLDYHCKLRVRLRL